MKKWQKQTQPRVLKKSKHLIRRLINMSWKKIMVILFLPLVYIVIDGTLTYDIFDFKMDSLSKWLVLLIISALILAIYLTDNKKAN